MFSRTFFRIERSLLTPTVSRHNLRSISFQKVKRAFVQLLYPQGSKPPYLHVCQIGDPVLRRQAMYVEPHVIQTPEFRYVLECLKDTMKMYDSVGLSAPQIGLPWQIFAVQVTEKYLKETDEKIRSAREMNVVPFQIFINPVLKVIDHRTVTFPEACESVRGFVADVPRAREVQITALNESNQQVKFNATGWTARILQHEYDHLKGILYVDKMEPKSLIYSCWQEVNRYRGNMEIRFLP